MLAQYATHAETQTFLRTGDRHQRRSFDLSDLDGYWFVYASEFNFDSIMDMARVKWATGGEGVHVEAKGKDGRDMKTHFGLWFGGNTFPRILNPDDAIYRRTMIFPCDIVLGEVDRTLDYAKEMVREEGPGILAQLLRWRADYRREGLKWTPRMKELRDELVYANDKHRNFANDCADFDPKAFVDRTRYYERFCAWCKAEKHELMSATEFYRQIAAHPLYKPARPQTLGARPSK